MASYLLDTNHLAAAVRPVSTVRERIRSAHRDGNRLGICVPVLCELAAGILGSKKEASLRKQLGYLLRIIRIWPLDPEIASIYGQLFHSLRNRGVIASQVDMMLYAMAKHRGLTILTSDNDFQRMGGGVSFENWMG